MQMVRGNINLCQNEEKITKIVRNGKDHLGSGPSEQGLILIITTESSSSKVNNF
jgi:hypothetical protein